MKRVLIQPQLSNYTPKGKWVLECDSGWQMCINRAREMLKLNPELHIDIMGPNMDEGGPDYKQCVTWYDKINPDLWDKYGEEGEKRLRYVGHRIIPNAIVSRYDFDWTGVVASALDLGMHKIGRKPKYDVVYINDPMHLRALKAAFHLIGGYQPKFVVHSHFIDNPSCPKFPKETSMWLGQCEAAIRADYNFWQCDSSMETFFKEMHDFYRHDVVQYVRDKSAPWDDGFSLEELFSPIDHSNIRFDVNKLMGDRDGPRKAIIFVPNRIGKEGVSSDYTNCGKFMFEVLPKLRKLRQDFIVVAGNPSQKVSNEELEQACGPYGYVNLVQGALNRDEYKLIIKDHADIAVGLYDQDTYGGTAARECVAAGCLPLWIDNYEYSSIAQEAERWPFLAAPDMKDLHHMADTLVHHVLKNMEPGGQMHHRLVKLQEVIHKRCSYEETTKVAMEKMGLLPG